MIRKHICGQILALALLSLLGTCLLSRASESPPPGGEPLRSATKLARVRRAEPLPKLASMAPVHTGEFSPGGTMQEVMFAAPATGRFFCLESLSGQEGKPYAAVAELDLLDEKGQLLSRDEWTIAYVDSEERDRENGAAENALDGQVASFWHTQWGSARPNHPHFLVLDLGRSCTVGGFRYVPRPGEAEALGRIKAYSIYVGDHLLDAAVPAEGLPGKCFLFGYFVGNGADGLHLAWSLDGYRWEAMNRGRSFLKPMVGESQLMRDPCLLRGPDSTFHLVWTPAWKGQSIGYASSKDLVHWSKPQAIPVMSNEPAALNCWAPEVVWDQAKEQFLLFWASTVTNRFAETAGQAQDGYNHRLYCTTTKDFKSFSPTRLFYDPGFNAIDGTLLQAKGRYYLIFKDETANPPRKQLRIAVGTDSPEGPFGPAGPALAPDGVEGPTAFHLADEVILYFDAYRDKRFGALKTKDLVHWEDTSARLVLPRGAHHGTVLEVPGQVLLPLVQARRVEVGPTAEAAELGIGNWIWTTNTTDKQTCRLWRAFTVSQKVIVSQATLRMTADNGYGVFLDGREIGRGGDLTCLTEYDLTWLISPGTHVLAVEAFNDAMDAGLIAGLHLEYNNGESADILSDSTWRVVPEAERGWQTRKQAKASWIPAQLVAYAGRSWWRHPARMLRAPTLQPAELHFWQQGWVLVLLLTLCLGGTGLSLRQAAQLAFQRRSQRLLERERARIARDIHDDLGAGLTQLTLLGELMLREMPAGSETRQQADALCDKARLLLSSMDEIVWTVNPKRDTVADFAAFVCQHAQEFLGATPIRCRLDVQEDLPALPMDLPARRNLLLAVKEAVRNAARHSGASELSVQIRMIQHRLEVEIADNGQGFSAAAIRAGRNGLGNMEQRLSDIGGSCRVTSAPGAGCRISFMLPLTGPRAGANWLAEEKKEKL